MDQISQVKGKSKSRTTWESRPSLKGVEVKSKQKQDQVQTETKHQQFPFKA